MGPPEAATPPLRFLRALTCRDRALRPLQSAHCPRLVADGFATHPYALRWPPDYPGPGRDDVTIGSLGRLTRMLHLLARRRALATPSGGEPPLYLTEFGYHADSRTIRERARATFSIPAFDMSARNVHVRQLVWYQLGAPPSDGRRREWDTALLRLDGRPRPTFLALSRWIATAVHRGFVAPAR